MKYLIAFLSGLLLFALVAAEPLKSDKPLSQEVLNTKVINCPGGFEIAVIYYEDRAEFYLDSKRAFAVIGKLEDDTIVVYIRTADGIIHKFDSGEEASATLSTPCEVAQGYRVKKQGFRV
jgi:hypothetical protein